jgi:hypothetical protein
MPALIHDRTLLVTVYIRRHISVYESQVPRYGNVKVALTCVIQARGRLDAVAKQR